MYEIEHQSLIFTGGKRCRFAGDIADIVTFDEVMVIRLVDNPVSILHNVYGVDYRGAMLWQIPRPATFQLQRPYVSVSSNCGRVNALNWDGHVITLHAKSGVILHEDFSSHDSGSPSRRIPHPRQWL